MDILSYLSELIQTRKAVGITGLGTVLKIKTPGKYDAETHSFVPPSYTIDFTSDVKEDVLLAEFISKKRNVSIDTALYFINEFSDELQKQLNDGKEINLGDLGKLTKNDGQLKFIPSAETNYGFDFYGFPTVKEEQEPQIKEIISEMPEVEETAVAESEPVSSAPPVEPITEEPKAEEQPIPLDEPTIESVVADNESMEENPGDGADQLLEEIESLNFYRSKLPYLKDTGPADEEVILKLNDPTVDEPVRTTPTLENRFIEPMAPFVPPIEEPRTFMRNLKIILGLVILVLMMSIVYFIKPEWFNGLLGKSAVTTHQAAPSVSTDPLPIADTTVVKDSTEKNKPNDTIVKATAALPVRSADTTTLYEIIGASMHDQKEADNFIAQMKKSGVNAKVVTNMSGKRLKISIATLKDEKSAKLELDRLAAKLKIPGIYIYKNKQ